MNVGKDIHTVSFGDVLRTFGKIGFLSFGGPAAQISVMHRVLVDEKRWLSEQQFLHALSFCMLLPGPEAMQLATYVGWRLQGVRGGLMAGMLFILPGLVMMLGLAWAYMTLGDFPVLAGVFYGLKAAVIAVVLHALIKLVGKSTSSAVLRVIAVGSFLAMLAFRVPFPLVVLGAGCVGFLVWRFLPSMVHMAPSAREPIEPTNKQARMEALRQSGRGVFVWGGLWLVALLAVLIAFDGVFEAQAALFFSQVAVVSFGGAYAVLAYVAQQAVDVYGWLTAADMLTGLGLAETTLGPLVLVLVFVGFVGGFNAATDAAVWGGLWGGLIAAFFTFVPCFVWIFVGAPHVERLRQVRWLTASLSAVTAAVVGVIANLAVWFSLNVLFGSFDTVQWGAVYWPSPSWTQIDFVALAIALSAGIALLVFNARLGLVLAGAALTGIVVGVLG